MYKVHKAESKTNRVFKGIMTLGTFYFMNFSLVSAQQHEIDSLTNVVKSGKEDTNKVNNLITLSLDCRRAGKMKEALDFGFLADTLATKLNYNHGLSAACNKIGAIYYLQGDYPKALDNYFKALHIDEALNDKFSMAKNLGNVGNIYYAQQDFKNALEYDNRTLRLTEAIGYKQMEASTLGNIGIAYDGQQKYDSALYYYGRSLAMNTQLHDKNGAAINIVNQGAVYNSLGKYDTAYAYFYKGMLVFKELDNKKGIINTMANIGEYYTRKGKFSEAENYLTQAKLTADSLHFMGEVKSVDQLLSNMYAKSGRWQKAYELYEKYSSIKDSLVNEDKSKEIGKLEARADYNKQLALQQADEDKRTELAKAESRRQIIIIVFVAIITIAIGIAALIIFRSLRITRKQKSLIEEQKVIVEEQKHLVEEKNKEIVDSITYAKRLQDAILPPVTTINKYLHDSFLLYKPKDIVAGDFYWLERTESATLIAAADCTGHGVPGAMVSVVCSNALNRAVKEFRITEPGKILDKVRELVLETFEKSGGEIKDGMDISLCAVSINGSGKEVQIQWSGAYNPLWYIHNNEIKEVGPDKQPIGKHDNPQPFTNHNISLEKGDTLFLFTDGYADQFGGPKGKKFMYKQLQGKLLAVNNLPMQKQKKLLEDTIETWRWFRTNR